MWILLVAIRWNSNSCVCVCETLEEGCTRLEHKDGDAWRTVRARAFSRANPHLSSDSYDLDNRDTTKYNLMPNSTEHLCLLLYFFYFFSETAPFLFLIGLWLNTRYVVDGRRSRELGHESQGSEFIRLPDLAQVVQRAASLSNDVALTKGLGLPHRQDDQRASPLWSLLQVIPSYFYICICIHTIMQSRDLTLVYVVYVVTIDATWREYLIVPIESDILASEILPDITTRTHRYDRRVTTSAVRGCCAICVAVEATTARHCARAWKRGSTLRRELAGERGFTRDSRYRT